MAGIFSERAWNKVWLYRSGFLKGLGTTAETALFGLILALILGIIFGLMATSNKKVLRGISRVYVEFFQNTPVLLQLCFLYYALAFSGNSIGILATGFIALGIYHGAYMAEVVRSGIQAVPRDSLRRPSLRALTMWSGCTTSFCRSPLRSFCLRW